MCKALRISFKEFRRREQDDDQFAQLVEFGRLSAKAWWIQIGRKAAISGAPSQAFQFWYANMKNQFGWADKTETTETKAIENSSNDEIAAKITALQNKIKKLPKNVEMQGLIDSAARH